MDDCYLVLVKECDSKEIHPIGWLKGYRDERMNFIIPVSSYRVFCKHLFRAIGDNLVDELDIPAPSSTIQMR